MASTQLAELLVRIGADISDYTAGIDEAIKKGKEAESALSGIGKGLSAVFTVPLAAIGGDALKAASQLKEALNVIRVSTGATGDNLQQLGQSFKTVFQGVPDSAKTVAEAIGALNTRLGQTGAPLEALATQVLDLARITHSDLNPLIAATTRAFADWSIATNKQGQALDYLFKVSQGTGINVTRLTELVVQFGAPMRALGFSFEQATTLLGKFEKEGVNMEAVMPGLRRELGNFAKAGIDASAGFKAIIDSIKNAKTDAQGLTIALQVFGQRAATDVFRAIKEGRFEVDALAESFRRSTETIAKAEEDTKTLGERMKEMSHQIDIALAPIGKVMANAMRSAFDSLKPLIEEVGVLGQKFAALPQHTQNVIVGLGAIAAAAGPAILALQKLSSLVIKPVINLGGEVVSGISGLAGAVKNVVFAVQNGLTGALTTGEMMLLRFGQAGLIAAGAFVAFENFKDIAASVSALSTALSNNVSDWDAFIARIKSAATDMLDTVRSSLGSVAEFFGSMWDGLIGLIPDSVRQGFRESGNWIVSQFADIADRVKHFDIWQAFKDATPLGNVAAAIRDTANAIEYFGGKYAAMDKGAQAVLGKLNKANAEQSRVSTQALEEQAQRRGIDTRSAQDRATAPKVDLSKLPGVEEKLRKAAEEARRFGEALESLGIAAVHTEKLSEALDLVTKKFREGKITADQFGTAIFTAIEKELAGARKLADSDFAVGVDPAQIKAFKAQLDGINNAFKTGQLSVEQYRDALEGLETEFGQATGTLGRIGLKFFNIPDHEELQKAAALARKYFEDVENDATRMWYEIDEARKKAVAVEDKSDEHARALAIFNLPSEKKVAAELTEVVDAYSEIYDNVISTLAQKSTAARGLTAKSAANDDHAWALHAVGLRTPEELQDDLDDALRAYGEIINNKLSTWTQKWAAERKVITVRNASNDHAQALKWAGFPAEDELKSDLERATHNYEDIVSNATSTWFQKSQAAIKKAQEENKENPFVQALRLFNLPDPEVVRLGLNQLYDGYGEILSNETHTWAQERKARLQILEKEAAEDTSDLAEARRILNLPDPKVVREQANQAIQAYRVILNDASQQMEDVVKAFNKQLAEKEGQAGTVESALRALNIPGKEKLDTDAKAFEEYYQRIAKAAKDGTETWIQANQALIASVDAAVKAGQELADKTVANYLKAVDQLNGIGAKLKFAENIKAEFNRAFDELEGLLAKNLVEWGHWKDSIINIGKDLAEGLLKTFIVGLFKPLTDQLGTLAATAATKLGGLIGIFGKGGSAAVDAVSTGIDAVEGGVDTAISVAGGAAQTAGGIAQGASGAAGAAGALGTIGSIANIAGLGVSIASGIVSGIQGARTNNLLGGIEVSTRGTLAQLISIQMSLNDALPKLTYINDYNYNVQMPLLMSIIDEIINLSNRITSLWLNAPIASGGGEGAPATAPGFPVQPQPQPAAPSGAENPATTPESDAYVPQSLPEPVRYAVPYASDIAPALTGVSDGLRDFGGATQDLTATTEDQTRAFLTVGDDLRNYVSGVQSLTDATEDQTRVLGAVGDDMRNYATAAQLLNGEPPINTTGIGAMPSSPQQAEIERLQNALFFLPQSIGPNSAWTLQDAQNSILGKINEIMRTGVLDDGAVASFSNADVTFDNANVTFAGLDFSAPSVPSPAPAQSFGSMANALPAMGNSGTTVNVYNPTFDSQSRIDSFVSTLESRGARF